MATSQGDTFKIGFALSGAISAGAYTVGVLDYFFQALNAWEKVRGEEGVPEHRVELQVITGASAGAITGALGVVALARGIRPQQLTDQEKRNTYPVTAGTPAQDLRCVLPSLYETWVTRPRNRRSRWRHRFFEHRGFGERQGHPRGVGAERGAARRH